MLKVLRISLTGLFFALIFFAFLILFPKSSASAISCTTQTGTTSTRFTASGTGNDSPSATFACCQNLQAKATAAGCGGTSCADAGDPTQSKQPPYLWGVSCFGNAICPVYSSWTCPASQCQTCTYYGGSVSCNTTVGYCNYSSVTPNSPSCGASCATPTCTAGTGSTPASCGGVAYYACTGAGSNCEQYTYRCSGSSCVAGAHQGGFAQSYCCSAGLTCSNGSCVAPPTATPVPTPVPTPAPTPPPVGTPNCNTGVSCGACSVSCGGGTQSCNYYSYTGGGACNVTFAYSQSCNTQACPTSTPTPTPIPTPIPTYIISGNVYDDNDNSATKSIVAGDTNHSGITMTLSNGSTANTNGGGNYSFAAVPAGSYTVSLPATVAGFYEPIPTSPFLAVPPDQVYNFRLVPLSTVNINVYYDYNGNGSQEPLLGETAASGQTVTITGGGAQTYTTNGLVRTISNLNVPWWTTISVALPNATWTSTTTNPVTVFYPPPTVQTVNIGIRPPAPTCTGGLTANPTSVSPGGTSTLTAVGCTSPTGGTLNYTYYDDSTIIGDSVTNNNTNTSTFTAPNPYWTQTVANPSVAVCNPGGAGALCSNYGTAITIVPVFSIAGNVFTDTNKNELKDAGEPNYSPITITSTGGTVVYPDPNNPIAGTYQVSGLAAGEYTVSYTSLPSGSDYQMTFPVNGPPPFFTVTVGAGCSAGISNSASCDINNNIINLNYGITNSIPWIQVIGGGDIGGDGGINTGGSGTTGGGGTGGAGAAGGFNDPIPSTALAICGGPYASVPGNTSTTPGLIFTGNGSAYFGQGSASLNNWVVGATNFGPISQGGLVKTSYAYLQSIAKQASITPTDLLPFCGAGGFSGCNLNFSTLPHGIYIANNHLTLTGNGTPPTYTFPSDQNYIILVGGNLTIQTELHVPVGSTALFSASGDIIVDKSVGATGALGYQSSTPHIEGIFSADQNFIVNGQNDCTIGPDLKLNVAGSIITNAALSGGTFTNQRDLCANNVYCPVFTVQSRPDFILNAPNFIKKANYTWQEVAP